VRTGGGCPKLSRVPSTRKALCAANLPHRKLSRHFANLTKPRSPVLKFSGRFPKANHILKNRKVATYSGKKRKLAFRMSEGSFGDYPTALLRL
jgi:hypothetical protein